MVSLEVWTTSFSQCIRKESIFNFSFSKTSRFLKIFGNFWSFFGNDARICKNKNWDWTWDWSVEPICPRLFLNIKDYFSTDNKWHWSDIFDFFSNRTCQEHSIKREASSSISKQLEKSSNLKKQFIILQSTYGFNFKFGQFLMPRGLLMNFDENSWEEQNFIFVVRPSAFQHFFNNFWQFLTTHF